MFNIKKKVPLGIYLKIPSTSFKQVYSKAILCYTTFNNVKITDKITAPKTESNKNTVNLKKAKKIGDSETFVDVVPIIIINFKN